MLCFEFFKQIFVEKTGIAMDEGYHGDNGESEEEAEPQISEALRQKLAKVE